MGKNAPVFNKPWIVILGWLLLLCLALAAATAHAQQASPDERQVRALVQNLAQAYLRKDLNAMLATASEDAELVEQGLAGTVRHKGKEKIRAAYAAQLRALHAPTLDILKLEVKAREGMAQATLEVMAGGRWGQEQVGMPARLSLLLEKRRGQWAVYYAQARYPLLRPEFEQLLGR